MHRELWLLLTTSGLLLFASGILWVCVPSQRPDVCWRAVRKVLRQESFQRRTAFRVLCLIVAVSMPFWPQRAVDRTIAGRILGASLVDSLQDPVEALPAWVVAVAVTCVLLMPLCDDRYVGPRSSTLQWSPSGPRFSHHRHKRLSRVVACVCIPVVAGLFLFVSLLTGMASALFVYVAWMAWSARCWVEADDVGVNWTGYLFRWAEVASWRIVFTPWSGEDDGSGDHYRIHVTLSNGRILSCEETNSQEFERLFLTHVPDKREAQS